MRDGGTLRRHADWIWALALFASLTALTWRRWASFDGDLNREWTTPARVAAGERLYRDVAFYYGPLAPEAESLAFRSFGARVGTVIAWGLLATIGTLAAMLIAARRFLPPLARAAVASVAIGVFAFAPANGAFIACYSQSALLAVGLSWLAFLLADGGRAKAAGVTSGLALLSKVEAAPALAAAFLRLPARRRWIALALAGGLAAAGYTVFLAGIPVEELVRYGPLRHVRMPAAFAELYRRISGLHPALLPRAIRGSLAGAGLILGWLGIVGGALSRATARTAAGLALFTAAACLRPDAEAPLTTVIRGIPIVLLVAIGVAFAETRRQDLDEASRLGARRALAAGLLGLGFIWRTFLWTVPWFPYAPLGAVSSLPAVLYLVGVSASRSVPEPRRGRATTLLLLPPLLAPLFFAPRLVDLYGSPRTAVVAPRGTWFPPDEQGLMFSRLVDQLQKRGVHDRGLVAIPEASVLNFLLGARSPLRLEQLLPGLLDDTADADAAARLDQTRPEWIVWVPRPTAEFGGGRFGSDYGRRIAAAIAVDYAVEARIPGGDRGQTIVYRRKPERLPPGTRTDNAAHAPVASRPELVKSP